MKYFNYREELNKRGACGSPEWALEGSQVLIKEGFDINQAFDDFDKFFKEKKSFTNDEISLANEYNFLILKENAIKKLESDYEKSKKIKFIQADNEEMTIVDREHFFSMIENLKRGLNESIGESDLVVKKHINDNEKKELIAMVYFQRVVFYDRFIFIHDGLPISIREENFSRFTKYKAQIDKCQSANDLDAVFLDFLNPDGVLIDVQAEAQLILNNAETPDIVKQKIEERRGQDGFIRLFYSY